MTARTDYDIGDQVVTRSGEHGVITGFDRGYALITTVDGAKLIVPVFELTREAMEERP